jgi:hypothetical protein
MARNPDEVKLTYGDDSMGKILVVIAMKILEAGDLEAGGWGLGKRVWEQMLADEGPEIVDEVLFAWWRAFGYRSYDDDYEF